MVNSSPPPTSEQLQNTGATGILTGTSTDISTGTSTDTSSDISADISLAWQKQLAIDLPDQPTSTHQAIAQWLVGEPERLAAMSPAEVKLARSAMDYRYRIFISGYWGLSPERSYKRLLQKLGGLFLIRSKVRTWIALSRDRKRAVKDVLQEVIQEMLQSDRYMQQQNPVDWSLHLAGEPAELAHACHH